jgi:hypothetical protein
MAMKGREGLEERMHTSFPFFSFWVSMLPFYSRTAQIHTPATKTLSIHMGETNGKKRRVLQSPLHRRKY